jgi:charged multivesicular body protein 6
MSEADKAQLKVKGQRDKLAQAQTRYSFLIEKTRENAKKLLQQEKKKEAMMLLKKKKSLEVQLKSVEDQFLQIEQMISSIETAGMQAKFVESMAAGNEALKSLSESMGGLEGVERLMEDTAEAQAEWEEIGEALGGSSSLLDAEDEEAVMEELAMLEEMEATDLALQMPDAPTTAPTQTDAEPAQVEEPEPERAEPAPRQLVAA